MAEDKTARLILGILLVLISLPLMGMGGMMGGLGYNYGMMGVYGYSGLGLWPVLINLVGLGLLGLGIYLIHNSLNK